MVNPPEAEARLHAVQSTLESERRQRLEVAEQERRRHSADELREHLSGSGIGTEIYYPVPLNRQKCFSRFATSWCPESEAAVQEVLALPIFPELNDGEVEMVASAVIAFFKK